MESLVYGIYDFPWCVCITNNFNGVALFKQFAGHLIDGAKAKSTDNSIGLIYRGFILVRAGNVGGQKRGARIMRQFINALLTNNMVL